MINPIKSTIRITSPYGMRTLGDKTAMHNGIDIVPADGKHPCDVIATVDGTVTAVLGTLPDTHTGLNVAGNLSGNYVYYTTSTGYQVKCMHLKAKSVTLKVGDKVKAGDKIGVMGTTGQSTGVHLHYELRDPEGKSFDPLSFMGNDKVPAPKNAAAIAIESTRPLLRQGSKGPFVSELQQLLNKKIKSGLAVDGVFGVKTADAVFYFQQSRNIGADRIVGVVTWGELLK